MKERNCEERILEAALDVVRENTISGTRMHQISDRAGMVQSNVHYWYRTKDKLMSALQAKVLNKCLEIRDELRASAEDTLESQLDVFIRQKREFVVNLKAYDYAEIDFWVQGRINDECRQAFAASFSGWRDEIGKLLDHYAPGMDPAKRRYVPCLTVALLEGATLQYLTDEEAFDLDEYFDMSKQTILEAIG